MAKYTKIEIAIHHFSTAVNAYHRRDLLTALHCAGAADEIAGKLCSKQGNKDSLNELDSLHNELRLRLSNKELINHLNDTKNKIKHADRDADAIVEIDAVDCLFTLLMAGLNIMRTRHERTQSILDSLRLLNKIRIASDTQPN